MALYVLKGNIDVSMVAYRAAGITIQIYAHLSAAPV
jgi:hypothetical protein